MNKKLFFLALALAGQGKADHTLMGGGYTCSPHIISCAGQDHISFACLGQDPCKNATPLEEAREKKPHLVEGLEHNQI